ncbi:MAG TPA: PIN domain nuclease [Gammaproteobacteria bacterium]|nr:PIN domain nuclease [Gammaproteobacteria bacterium]
MIFVDSSVWIDYFNGNQTPETEKLDSILGSSPICIGDIVLTEVLQGFRNDNDFNTAKKLLSSLVIVNVLDTNIALKSADNFRALRKKGVTVRKTIDIIIATYCIENSVPLLHSDKDFIPFHKHLKLANALLS